MILLCPNDPYLNLIFVVIFNQLEGFEFWSRICNLSSNKCQMFKQLSILSGTITYFNLETDSKISYLGLSKRSHTVLVHTVQILACWRAVPNILQSVRSISKEYTANHTVIFN